MTLGMLTIVASTVLLMISASHSTVKLFAARAASMGAYTVLFIYTPEVVTPSQDQSNLPWGDKSFASCALSKFAISEATCVQVYPTRIRSFGLGLNNSMSRWGAILAPLLSVDLAQSGHLRLAEGVIAGICLLAALCTCLLPYETSGRDLQVCSHPPEAQAGLHKRRLPAEWVMLCRWKERNLGEAPIAVKVLCAIPLLYDTLGSTASEGPSFVGAEEPESRLLVEEHSYPNSSSRIQ